MNPQLTFMTRVARRHQNARNLKTRHKMVTLRSIFWAFEPYIFGPMYPTSMKI